MAKLSCLAGFVIMLACGFTGCEAPRDNPFDPENPSNKLQYIRGTVKSIRIPYTPIENVRVFWPRQSILVFSTSDGSFIIESYNAKDGWLYFTKNGYYSDSVYVKWNGGSVVQCEVFLNARPVAVGSEIYSSILNRYPSLQVEQLNINLKISDADNDIDSVFVHFMPFDILFQINYNPASQWYERSFSQAELPVSNSDQLIGKPIYFKVKDIFGHQDTPDSTSLKRVIREEILFISPAGNDTTSITPILSWYPFEPGYTIYYTVEVYTSEISPQLIWQTTQLPDTTHSVMVTPPLPPAEYFWLIWAVDEFGNRCSSKPASFIALQ